MRLDETDGRRVGSSPRPGTLDSELLPDWVRRCDAFAFTVRRTADPNNHRINAVAVALGVGQSLEDEQSSALAHHETVGARVERPRPRGR